MLVGSPSAIITLGLGLPGSASLLVTLGFGAAEADSGPTLVGHWGSAVGCDVSPPRVNLNQGLARI